ncbi:hypothetical protein [Rheinheimera pacifica]|nr:hypothetical protein [Rheinheimera pacifica]
MKIKTVSGFMLLTFSAAAANWHEAGLQSGALTMCAQLPYEFSAEQKKSFTQLSEALYFASEKHPERKQAFLDGTMSFLSSLERGEKAVFSDGESAVMATLTTEKCLSYAAAAGVTLSSAETQ